jgi:hypothetical protein
VSQHSTMEYAQASAQLEHATVKACTDAGLIIHGPAGVATAQVAVGCLLEPMAGDRVLVTQTGEERFVLTVLARASEARTIRVPGHLAIQARELSLRGDHDVALASGGSLGLSSPRLKIHGQDTRIQGRNMAVTAEHGEAHFAGVRLVADRIETIGDRIVQCARQVVRRVEEVETLHVGNLIQRVRENLLSRSKRASITASKDVHIDGERIHMG